MKPPLSPLCFERIFLEKVWGGRALERAAEAGGLGLALPPKIAVGETWELVDRADANSVVTNGAYQGARLEELMADHSHALLGSMQPSSSGRFPLLVKYIDAHESLSVQVHPSNETVARLPQGRGFEAKSEAWVILGSTPAGRIYHGFAEATRNPAGRAAFERDMRAGETLERHLRSFAPRAGDCFFVPGGTVHAIGGGVTLIEVQQNSDTTFRVNDWGRVGLDGQPRDLHVDEALACFDYDAAPEPVRGEGELATCSSFAMGALTVTSTHALSTHERNAPRVLACVGGAGVLRTDAGEHALQLGDVWLVPASIGDFAVASLSPTSELRLIVMDAPRS